MEVKSLLAVISPVTNWLMANDTATKRENTFMFYIAKPLTSSNKEEERFRFGHY